jgi:hypothetical protein
MEITTPDPVVYLIENKSERSDEFIEEIRHMNIGIIITGIIEEYYLDRLIESYQDCEYIKIISTWDYTNQLFIEKLRENNFIVIQSKLSDDIYKTSVNYQTFLTKKGIEYAISSNITHCIRLRSDLLCNNINKLLYIYTCIYNGKLIFLAHLRSCKVTEPAYLIDYAYFGKVHDMLAYNLLFQTIDDNRFVEQYKQETYFRLSKIEHIEKLVTFSILYLLHENIDFHFTKRNYEENTNCLHDYNTYNIKHNENIYYTRNPSLISNTQTRPSVKPSNAYR